MDFLDFLDFIRKNQFEKSISSKVLAGAILFNIPNSWHSNIYIPILCSDEYKGLDVRYHFISSTPKCSLFTNLFSK